MITIIVPSPTRTTFVIKNDVNKGKNEWKARFRYIEGLLIHIVCYYWGKEQLSLYRRLRYIEVRYIEVPL